MKNDLNSIHKIRSFNRFYTKVLGLLDQHILESEYSLTEARILLEIGKADKSTAIELGTQLGIDRSYMSRIIRHLEKDQLIIKKQSEKDSRIYEISLTENGKLILEKFNKRSDEQIYNLFKCLKDEEEEIVMTAMNIIKNRVSESMYSLTIRNFNGDDIDYLIARHQTIYPAEYGFSQNFANDVNRIIHKFVEDFDKEKECILIAELDGKRVGSIAIAKSNEDTAQLRFFLLEPEARGKGIGKKLIENVIEFSRNKGYKHMFLETVSKLEVARRIYKSRGFEITSTHENPDWGEGILEEHWEMDL